MTINNSESYKMADIETDVLIIGCGIAGLTAAIKLGEKKLKVLVITREEKFSECNTYWAQGGIIYPRENLEMLIEDIYNAGSKTSNLETIELMARTSGKIVEEILLGKVNVSFSRNKNSELEFTKEAAHSLPRIIYQGDYTGRVIQEGLLSYLRDTDRFPTVTLLSSHTAIDLITPAHHGVNIDQRYEHRVVGAYVLDQKNEQIKKIIARKVVLATGGVGAIYLHHSNSENIRGDGQAMAQRAGALLLNMEFIQFHPTTFYDRSSHQRFLISEAVRGEGGILLNADGQQFMHKYHPQKELAPRDVVARAILSEMIESGQNCVYLDITFKGAEWIRKRFPTIYANCLSKGIDITTEPIPVVPSAHYTCGGVQVGAHGETTLPNLYAVGEVACTGLHGANRLASTSLLEGLTWGYLAAEDIIHKLDIGRLTAGCHNCVNRKISDDFYDGDRIKDWLSGTAECEQALVFQDWLTIKQTMWNYVGPTRSRNRLRRARAIFGELSEEIYNFYYDAKLNDSLIGLRNAVEVARTIVDASLRNRRSVGCFYIND